MIPSRGEAAGDRDVGLLAWIDAFGVLREGHAYNNPVRFGFLQKPIHDRTAFVRPGCPKRRVAQRPVFNKLVVEHLFRVEGHSSLHLLFVTDCRMEDAAVTRAAVLFDKDGIRAFLNSRIQGA